MTKFFIEKFKKGLKCWGCKKEPIAGYKMCLLHLTKARERFANWSEERRQDGKCIRCDRRSHKGYLRCKTHTVLNRVQCLSWMSRHPERNAEAWEKRKVQLDLGICICKAKNKIPAGFRRCDDCRTRRAGYRVKEKQNETRI
jgi:hypothetical protein